MSGVAWLEWLGVLVVCERVKDRMVCLFNIRVELMIAHIVVD